MLQDKLNELDSENNNIIWEGKRKFYLVATLFFLIYLITGIFFSWIFWAILLLESFWYVLIAIPFTLFYIYEIYKTFNLKSIFLTQNGLLLRTLLNGNIFYPYGYFTAGSSLAIGIKYFERVSIDNINLKIEFIFPYGYDSFGCFENNTDFKRLCTQYTQNALDSMNTEQKINLYKLYRANIDIILNEERNHNIFMIDFKPYEEEIKKYFYNELQETLKTINTKEKTNLYKTYKVLFERTKNLQYNTDYFTPYKQEIESYLKANQ